MLGAGPDLDRRDRGADARAQGAVLDRHRHAQHAAGRARVGPDGVLQRRRSVEEGKRVGRARRVRRRPRRSSRTRTTSAPRSTSPGSSADGRRTVAGVASTIRTFQEELERARGAARSAASTSSSSSSTACSRRSSTRTSSSRRWSIADDDRIDGRYLEVHQGILSLLALQAPVAGDLRLVAALLHVIKHVERMGDQCVNIAQAHPADRPRAAGARRDARARCCAWAAPARSEVVQCQARVRRARRRAGRGPRAPGPRDQPAQPRGLPAARSRSATTPTRASGRCT